MANITFLYWNTANKGFTQEKVLNALFRTRQPADILLLGECPSGLSPAFLAHWGLTELPILAKNGQPLQQRAYYQAAKLSLTLAAAVPVVKRIQNKLLKRQQFGNDYEEIIRRLRVSITRLVQMHLVVNGQSYLLASVHFPSKLAQDEVSQLQIARSYKAKLLVTLLPDFEQIQNIEINPPTVFSQYSTGGLVITTRHGQKIPFNDFSLGYKTITSWVVDLAWRLFSKHHLTSENPLEEPAIVLIDEIDLHLHPKWQQQIMSNLSLHFPNIQFIATAHSPLMVQAAFDLNYAVLHYDKALGSVSITNRPEGVDGWRVDQILTSDFFDLKSARGTAFDKLLSDRDALLAKKRLTEPDKRRLKAINAQLAQPPTSENIEEVNNRRQLAELVQKMRNK